MIRNKREMEYLLSQFVSEEGKERVIRGLVKKGLEVLIPKKYFTVEILDHIPTTYVDVAEKKGLWEEVFEYYAKRGPLADAIRAAKKGKLVNTIGFFEEKECFDVVAEIAGEAGMAEKEKELWIKAMEHYEKKGSLLCYGEDADMAKYFVEAAQAAKKAGLTEKVKELTEKVKEVRIKAMRDCEKDGFLDEAIKYAEKLSLIEKIKELSKKIMKEYEELALNKKGYERGNLLVSAAEYAKKVGLAEKAKELYKRALEDLKASDRCDCLAYAAEIAHKFGENKEAEKLCIRALETYETAYNDLSDCLETSAKVSEKAGLAKKAEAYKKLMELFA